MLKLIQSDTFKIEDGNEHITMSTVWQHPTFQILIKKSQIDGLIEILQKAKEEFR